MARDRQLAGAGRQKVLRREKSPPAADQAARARDSTSSLRSAWTSTLTLRALAASLRLSPAAVSLVLNGRADSHFSPATHARVLSGAQRLGYRPNAIAQSLRRRRAFAIGLLVPDLAGYRSDLVQAVADRLRASGYLYHLAQDRMRTDPATRLVNLMLEREIDGLIVVELPQIDDVRVPVVMLVHTPAQRRSPGFVGVELHLERAASEAILHLRDLGHRRLGAFATSGSTAWSRAVQGAVRRQSLELDFRPAIGVDVSSFELGYRTTQQLLASRSQTTAILAPDDFAAMGGIRAVRDAGLEVPDDISVLGFGGHPHAAFFNPPLTTVVIPAQEVGQRAAELIVQQVESGREGSQSRNIAINARFTVRQTTGWAPAARRARVS